MNNAEVTEMIRREIAPLRNELRVALALIQAYETVFLSLDVDKAIIATAVSKASSAQSLDQGQRTVISTLLSSV